MIDLTAERPLSLTGAARLIPPGRDGKKCHISTLLRWIVAGARAPGGGRVRLEALRLGARWITSHQALQRFATALTPSHPVSEQGGAAPPSLRSPAQRRRGSERAADELKRVGI
jgi:hypothetical protein